MGHRSPGTRPVARRRVAIGAVVLLALSGAPNRASPDAVGAGDLFREEPVRQLPFRHFNGMVGAFYFPEMTGQGGALVDFDGDGDLDVYFRQGTMLGPGDSLEQALFPPDQPLGDRLFRNDLQPGDDKAAAVFVDVTDRSGLRDTGYGMGIAAGDYDGDGAVDLYLTNYGENQLWRNLGDGRFSNVTEATDTGDPKWSSSASFADLDRDGDLDLFSVNYVEFSVERNPKCFATTSARDYCGPSAFPPEPDRLWLNRGDGSFEDVSIKTGIGRARGAGLGVIAGDFDGDGSTDLYVANDGQANYLWLHREDGSFSEDALFSGTAFNRHGSPEASMGLAAADFDGDGDEDLFLTHLAEESNTFYRNLGNGLFEDRSRETRLAAPSMTSTAFGVAPIDFDNDGWPDLAIANGAVRIQLELAAKGDVYPLEQPNQLFRNLGNGSFEDVSGRAGIGFTRSEVSRGLGAGDLDNDGAADLVVFNNNGPARLLLNEATRGAGWVAVAGPSEGSRVRVETASGRTLTRTARRDGSYATSNDARVIVGLGEEDPEEILVESVERRVRLLAPPSGRYLVIRP